MTFLERTTSDIEFQIIGRELMINSSVFFFLEKKQSSIIQSYRDLN